MQKSFLLFLALSFIQCKTENYPITGTITLPFKTGEKYLSVTESDYQYSYHFISLETKEGSLLSKKTSNYQRKSNNIKTTKASFFVYIHLIIKNKSK